MFLGIDLGTSSVKLVLVDQHETVVAESSQPLTIDRPQALWSEQHPCDWWSATIAGLYDLKTAAPSALAATTGIGLSGQMHGAVLLDKAHDVLRPCILWNDGRASAECVTLEEAVPNLRMITGNQAFPGFTAPKLLWVRRHEPEVFDRIAMVLLPKAYLRVRLTGELVEDVSDASGTLWLDVGRRTWSETLLSACGLTQAQMPRLCEGNAPSGRLSAALSARFGMKHRPVVAGGAGDNAASAVGLGAMDAGDTFVSLGTSGVLWATTDCFRPNPDQTIHAFCHALPDLWHQMGVILSATSSLEWWAGLHGMRAADLVREVGEDPEPSGILFLPYLSGERTPHNDTGARGAFIGLGHDSHRAAMTTAVMQGVAFAFRDCLEALRQSGTRVAHVLATGGGARSRAWLRILASTLDVPVSMPQTGEHGAALGATRLGRMAATGEQPKSVCRPPPIAETFEPRAERSADYADQYRRYRALYPALKESLQ